MEKLQTIIECTFKIGHDASTSLIITLFTFCLGYFITLSVFLFSNYMQRIASRKIFLQNLNSVIKDLKLIEKGYQKSIESFNIVSNSYWQYYKTEIHQVLIFKEISYKESYKSFFLGFENYIFLPKIKSIKRKAFSSLWGFILNIESWNSKSYSDFTEALKNYNSYGNNRRETVNQLRKFWENLFFEAGKSNGNISKDHRDYLSLLDKIIKNAKEISTDLRVAPFTTHRKIVLPIRILNRRFPDLQFIREFTDLAMKASNEYQNMEMILRNLRSNYQTYYFAFKKARRMLEKVGKIL